MWRLTPRWTPGCCWHHLPQHLVLVLHPGKGRQVGQPGQGPRAETSSTQGCSPPTFSTLGNAAGGADREGHLGWMTRVETPGSRIMYIPLHWQPLSLVPMPRQELVAPTWAWALRDWRRRGNGRSCHPQSPAGHLDPHGTEMKV